MRPQPPPGRATSPERLATLAAVFDSTRNLAAILQQGAEGGPARGSAAHRDRALQEEFASRWSQQPLEVVDRRGRALIDQAADHVWALRGLLEPRWPQGARHTLARVAVAASACAWWLYEPRLDARARLARGWTLALGSTPGPGGTGPVATPTGALTVIEAGEQLPMRLEGRPPRAFEEPPPPAEDLTALMLECSPAGEVRAWRARAVEALAAVLAAASAGNERSAAENCTTVATACLVLYTESFGRRMRYHGRAQDQWQQWRDHVGRVVTRHES